MHHVQENASVPAEHLRQAISAGMQSMDREVLKESYAKGWIDGAACVAAWVIGDTCCVANLGMTDWHDLVLGAHLKA